MGMPPHKVMWWSRYGHRGFRWQAKVAWLSPTPLPLSSNSPNQHPMLLLEGGGMAKFGFRKNLSILESEIFLSVGTDRNKEKFKHGWTSKQTPIFEIQLAHC